MTEIKYAARSAIIYSVGIVIQRIAGLVMLPVYTRFLTPADYGSLELLMMTSELVALITGLGISGSIFRFFYQKEDSVYQNNVISSALTIMIVLYSCVGFIGISLSPYLAKIILGGTRIETAAFMILFGYFILEPLNIIPFLFLRIQQKPVLFVSISLVKLVLQIALNVYFLVFLKIGFLGVLLSTFITQIIICVWLSRYLFNYIQLRFSKELAKEIINYSYPLVLAGLGAFISTFSDRYFLKAYADLSSVGVYSLAYKFGFLMAFLTFGPIYTVWEPKRFELAMQEDYPKINQRVFFFVSLAAITVALGIALFARDLLRVMSVREFWIAYTIVPYILIAYIFQGWTNYVNFGLHYCGKTKYLSLCSAITAGVIIILSFLLIPEFKAIGAAVATMIAFVLNFAIVYACAEKFYKLRLSWMKPVALLCVAVCLYLISRMLSVESVVASLLVNIGLFIVYLVVVVASPISEKQERQFYLKILKHPKMIFSLFKT